MATLNPTKTKGIHPHPGTQRKDKPPTEVAHKDYDEIALAGIDGPHAESADVDPVKLAKTIRKIDLIVLPIMTIILAFCFIDRANMGLAMVVGMGKELEFKSNSYSVALLVFFPGYALCVLPSNYILSKTPVRYWLTILSIGFGLFTLATRLVRNFGSLVAMRTLLGVCEAGQV